jgi:hypothetical protein
MLPTAVPVSVTRTQHQQQAFSTRRRVLSSRCLENTREGTQGSRQSDRIHALVKFDFMSESVSGMLRACSGYLWLSVKIDGKISATSPRTSHVQTHLPGPHVPADWLLRRTPATKLWLHTR